MGSVRINGKLYVAAGGLDRFDHGSDAIEVYDGIFCALKHPKRQSRKLLCISGIAVAADGHNGREFFRVSGCKSPGAAAAHAWSGQIYSIFIHSIPLQHLIQKRVQELRIPLPDAGLW